VTFTDNGAVIPGCSAVALNADGPTLCTMTVARGTGPLEHLKASYSGDTVYDGSSATISEPVTGDVKR
jgi:hypothetical protein